MDRRYYNDLLRQYDAAKGAPGARIKTALLACGEPEKHSPEIAAFLDTEGIPCPTDFLDEYAKYSEKARREAEETKARELAKKEIEATKEILTQLTARLDAGALPADMTEIKAVEDARARLAALTKTPRTAGLTPDNMHDFGTSGGYPIAFWNNLKIPTPGATLIGARTGGGKTSALINIARELLAQGRRVCFISYEMNAQEIGLALTLSIMAKSQTEPIPGFDNSQEGTGEEFNPPHDEKIRGTGEDDFMTDYFTNLKAHIERNGVPEYFKKAIAQLRGYLQAGTIAIHDALGPADALARYIEGTDFDAYLIDFIQAITPSDGAPSEGYRRIGATVDIIRSIVNAGKKTLILGAQFNREKGEGDGENGFDPILEQFREAADIEQFSTLALGIGWYKDTEGRKVFYWKVLKHRFNGAMREARMLSWGQFRYYLNQRGGPWEKAEVFQHRIPSKKKSQTKKIKAEEPRKPDDDDDLFKRSLK